MCIRDSSIGNLGAITGPTGTVYASSASGSVDHSGTQDCSGDYYGSAWESDCGCVAADNSGDDCDDCAGTPNGDALVDNCGTCDSDSSNDCTQDCAGTWGGDALADNCGTCDSDSSNDCTQDCSGEWGGSLVDDECGVCGGSGPAENFDCDDNCINASACGAATVTVTATGSTATVSYDSNFPVGGFQFNVAGVNLTDVTSGLGNTQYNASTGVVIGFDFTGATLPAGSGVLAELSFDEVAGGSTLALSNVTVSSGSGDTLLSGGGASADVPACTEDCAGTCSGDALVDNCGTCDSDSSNDCTQDCLSLIHI